MISISGKKYLELKQKTDRDVRNLGPIVQFRDSDTTVPNQTEYQLSFAVPIANKQLFKLHIDGKLLREGALNDFEFVEITSGYSSKINLNVSPASIMPMDYELSGARIAPFPNALTIQAEVDNLSLMIPNTGTSKPAASSSVRGHIYVTEGGTGVADIVEICLKDDTDAYNWVTIQTV